MGDTAHLPTSPPDETPLMWALAGNGNTFVIMVQDRRRGQTAPPPSISIIVRWWAIPKTLEQGDLHVPPLPPPPPGQVTFPEDFVVTRIIMGPGIGIDHLAEELKVQPQVLEVLLNKLVEGGRIRIDQGRLFPR